MVVLKERLLATVETRDADGGGGSTQVMVVVEVVARIHIKIHYVDGIDDLISAFLWTLRW